MLHMQADMNTFHKKIKTIINSNLFIIIFNIPSYHRRQSYDTVTIVTFNLC